MLLSIEEKLAIAIRTNEQTNMSVLKAAMQLMNRHRRTPAANSRVDECDLFVDMTIAADVKTKFSNQIFTMIRMSDMQ